MISLLSSPSTSPLAKTQNLNPTDADLENRYTQYAQQSGIELAKIKAFYSKPENRSRVRFQMMEERVVDFLISKANVKEVPKDKLPKEDELEN
jgi:trigger factor